MRAFFNPKKHNTIASAPNQHNSDEHVFFVFNIGFLMTTTSIYVTSTKSVFGFHKLIHKSEFEDALGMERATREFHSLTAEMPPARYLKTMEDNLPSNR